MPVPTGWIRTRCWWIENKICSVTPGVAEEGMESEKMMYSSVPITSVEKSQDNDRELSLDSSGVWK